MFSAAVRCYRRRSRARTHSDRMVQYGNARNPASYRPARAQRSIEYLSEFSWEWSQARRLERARPADTVHLSGSKKRNSRRSKRNAATAYLPRLDEQFAHGYPSAGAWSTDLVFHRPGA